MFLYFIAPLTAIYKLTYISLYFTFHFDHILISTYNIASRAYPSLYIPFWSYSNGECNLMTKGSILLYIPPLCQVLDTFFKIPNLLYFYLNFNTGFFNRLLIRSV